MAFLDIRRRAGIGEGWIDEPAALRASGAARDTLNRWFRQVWSSSARSIARPSRRAPIRPRPSPPSRQARGGKSSKGWTRNRRCHCCYVASPAAAKPNSTCARSPGACEQGDRRSSSRPRSRLRPSWCDASPPASPPAPPCSTRSSGHGKRLDAWYSVANSNKQVVIGPRSRTLRPDPKPWPDRARRDTEPAYKQESTPRSHARAVAERLAEAHGALLILGSATPSIESISRVNAGEYQVARLEQRVNPVRGSGADALELPPVTVVDLRNEFHQGHTSLLSRPLIGAMTRALDREQQSLLFLNRRGTATVVLCGDCGQSVQCPYCEIPHTWHEDRRRLICHRCGYQAAPPKRCETCGGHLQFLGAGTQRVVQVASLTFPERASPGGIRTVSANGARRKHCCARSNGARSISSWAPR